MDLKHKRRELQGVVGALGVVAALAGFVGGWMSPASTIVVTFGIWILGATLVNLLTEPPRR